jgi:hypothetical protein
MKGKLLTIPFLKATAFLAALLALSLTVKFFFPSSGSSDLESAFASANHGNGRTFFFVGSSRTRESIAIALLKVEFSDDTFVNLGLSSNSFLYSCQAASNVMQTTQGRKVVFIELAGLSLVPPRDFYKVMNTSDVDEVIVQHLSVRHSPQDLLEFVYYAFNIGEDLRRIFYPRLGIDRLETADSNVLRELRKGKPAIPSPERLSTISAIEPAIMNLYKNSINSLMTLAEHTGSQVIFVLPLAISENDELQIDMSVFSSLPAENKWQYTAGFLRSMDDSKYFADESHPNQAGATVYTRELLKFIRHRF